MASKKKKGAQLSQDELDDVMLQIALMEITQSEEKKSAEKPAAAAEAKGGALLVSNCGPYPWVSVSKASAAWKARIPQQPAVNNICVRECGGGGDCMFYAVSAGYALAHGKTPQEIREQSQVLMKQARKWLADSITPDNVSNFVHFYQQEKYSSEMNGQYGGEEFWPDDSATWKPEIFGSDRDLVFRVPHTRPPQTLKHRYSPSPETAKFLDINHPQFQYFPGLVFPPGLSDRQKQLLSANTLKSTVVKALVQKTGYAFQGDTEALKYMVEGDVLKRASIGFIILSNHGYADCVTYPEREPRDKYIILYHLGYHWQLAGIANDKNQVQVVFPRAALPEIVSQLYMRDCNLLPESLQ